jgi:hypothetical protein
MLNILFADLTVVMAANSGALMGSQLLRGDDAPLYRRGFKICVCLVSLGLLVSILQHLQYRLSNRRIQSRTKEEQIDIEAGKQGLQISRLYTI